jgi:2-aminoadipate transaminase
MGQLNVNKIQSNSVAAMTSSIIREALKLGADKSIISFAGGLPASESFPIDDIKEANFSIYEDPEIINAALQYGLTAGYNPLIDELQKVYSNLGLDVDKDRIKVTSSSQQGLDIVARSFINPGDKVILSEPSYLGAIQAFGFSGAEFVSVDMTNEGMSSKGLENALLSNPDAKFIYIIPDFQNPTGITMSSKRREEVAGLANKHNKLVIEDSPYKEIRFKGEHQPFIYSLIPDRTILLGTLSKILAPGFRIGWHIAQEELSNVLVKAKQPLDLCTGSFNQAIVAAYFKSGKAAANLENTIQLYSGKRDTMIDSFNKYLQKGIDWIEPNGGLFLDLTLDPKWGINTYDMLKDFVHEYKVAFIPGEAFSTLGQGKNKMRINFSYVSKEKIAKGVQNLDQMITAARKKYNVGN